jgi:hypothetical protein
MVPDKDRYSVFSKIYKFIFQAAIIAAIILFMDFVASLFLSDDLLSRLDGEHKKKVRIHSEIYSHDLVKNTRTIKRWGASYYEIITNSLGFKDGDMADVPLVSEKKRILFIGDSFTEGVGIEYPETFVGRIDRNLKSKDIDVLNAGVMSYSPAIYYSKIRYLLETVGLDFDELVVFIDLSDINNEVMAYSLDANGIVHGTDTNQAPRKKTGVSEFFRSHFMTVRLGYLLRDYFSYYGSNALFAFQSTNGGAVKNKKVSLEVVTNLEKSAWTYDPKIWEAYGREGVARAKANMTRLSELLAKHSITLSIAVYPWPAQVIRREQNSRQVTIWRDWAAANQARFYNFFPAFINHEDPESVIQKNFIPFDAHWNSAGHKTIADHFLIMHSPPWVTKKAGS